MKKILITNDDGITADGIIRLAKAAAQFGEVWVVAPDGERSCMSHSITLRHAFEAWKTDFPIEGVHAYACTGTPADCIRIGVRNIVPGKPDYVFTGINYGYNSATDTQYSATVGAALEGCFQKIHTIAFSEDATDMHEVTDRYLTEVMEELMAKPLKDGQIWNVNFPGCPLEECKGLSRGVKVSQGFVYDDLYTEEDLGNGRISYKVNGIRNYEAEEGTDLYALFNNYVSIGIVNNYM